MTTDETTGSYLFFFSSLFCFFPPVIVVGGPWSIEPAAVFIWVRNHHMYMTPGQSWQTEGKWGHMMEDAAHPLERQTLLLLSSHTYFLLHCISLTNVPWNFTLDVESRELNKKKWKCDAKMLTIFFTIAVLVDQRISLGTNANIIQV